MLSVPKLDDLSYDKLVERARGQIPAYTDEWTDFNDHDPGITTLQTFAWLVDTLNYYIDATGEEHRLEYLRLLGITSRRAAAQALIALSADGEKLAVAKGAKLAAGDTVFETAESFAGISNGMRTLFLESGGAFANLTPLAGVDGQYATLFSHAQDEDSAVYIGFERELKDEIRFYADVPVHPERNPFSDDFALTGFKWEFFDGERWREAHLSGDGTCGFLKGGFITLALDGCTKPMTGHPVLPQAHYLRASLVRGRYDALPKIGKIYMNCVQAVQTQTCAQALELEFDGEAGITVDYHVREDDLLCVAVGDGDGYSLWYEHVLDEDSLCEVATGAYPWQRVIRFDRERFGAYPEPGQKILVTITDAEYYDKLQLGATMGFARERLEIDIPNLYELRLALVGEKDGRPYLRLWDECGNLRRAGYDAKAFELNRETGQITFGDAISGLQPDAGQLVVAVTAKTSLLGDGNVRAGQICRVADDVYAGLSVHNPKDASGGCRPETSAELEQKIEEKIYKTTRAVTARDYMDIVKATPGLMIDCLGVISGVEYTRFYGGTHHKGAVLLAVKPLSEHESRPVLSEAYRNRIRQNIENYRLLTTDVRVIPAKYVRIEVDGRVVLTENTPLSRRLVEEKLRELTDFAQTRKFGANIVYGRIFSHLEMLDCVAKVSQISLSCAGDGAHKNEQGDIVVYPDALAWLGSVNIEFVREEGPK